MPFEKTAQLDTETEPFADESDDPEPDEAPITEESVATDAGSSALREENRSDLPPVTNDAVSVLTAWTALEVLSPPAFWRETDLTGGDRSISTSDSPDPLLLNSLFLGDLATERRRSATARRHAT